MVSCKPEYSTALGLYCDETIEQTVNFSSSLAYGVEISPPHVTNVKFFDETALHDVPIRSGEHLGLLSRDATDQFYGHQCDGDLCSVEDAKKTLAYCQKNAQCKIVGAFKNNTFFPLYQKDDLGGHICKDS